MSFQGQDPASCSGDPSQAVASGVFRINTVVGTFKRIVNALGTPKDTPDLRERLHKTRLQIAHQLTDTLAKYKQAKDHHLEPIRKIANAKLAKDFKVTLKDFHKHEQLAVKREIAYDSLPSNVYNLSNNVGEVNVNTDKVPARAPEQCELLVDYKRLELLLLDIENNFHESIAEEGDQALQEVRQQINEANEICKDLAVLVHDQGDTLKDVDSSVGNSLAAVTQAKSQALKAMETKTTSSSLIVIVCCGVFGLCRHTYSWILGILLLIVIIPLLLNH